MKKQWWIFLQVIVVVAALAGSVYVALTPANSLLRWYNIDDAFYYYKVAQNILAGHGVTFDGINLSNGFHPLWMVVCLLVFWTSRINLIFPLRLLVLVSGLFNAATALLLFRLLKKHLHPLAAFLASMFWALIPSIYGKVTVHGMESSISVFFIVLLIKTASDMNAQRERAPLSFTRMFVLGLIGAGTILARLDNVFLVGIVGLFLIFGVSHVSRRYFYDLLAVAVSVISVWYLRLGAEGIFINLSAVYLMLILSLLLKPAVFYFAGLYRDFNQYSKLSGFIRQAAAAAVNAGLVFVSLSLLHHFGFGEMVSRSIILYDAILSFVLIFCLRLFTWKNESAPIQNPFRRFFTWLSSSWKAIFVNGLGYAVPIAALVGAYMLFNKFMFGTFTPVSGQIKTWWGTLSNTVYGHPNTMLSVFGLSDMGNFGPWSMVMAQVSKVTDLLVSVAPNTAQRFYNFVFMSVLIIGLVALLAILTGRQQRLLKKGFSLYLLPLLVGSLVQIAYYNLIGYQHTRSWYWLAQVVVVALLVGLVLDALFTWLDGWKPKGVFSVGVCLILVAVLLNSHLSFLLGLVPPTVSPEHASDYIAEVQELQDRTEPGDRIGMTGGGLVAYFIKDRTIVNLDGLINSAAYFNAMKSGKARDFLDALPLNYVYAKAYVITESDPYKEIFTSRLDEIGIIKGFENFTLYKYVISQ